MKLLQFLYYSQKNDFQQIWIIQATLKHEDIILNRSNNSVFLLQNSIKIGIPLTSFPPWEFEWSSKLLVIGFFLKMLDVMFRSLYLGASRKLLLQLFLIGFCFSWSKTGKEEP